MLIKRLKERGDTIIEVLIAIAIISFILAGGYVTADRSSGNVEDSEEHEIATTIAQTQLELLNSQPNLLNLGPKFTSGNITCYNPTNYHLISSGPVSGIPGADPSYSSDKLLCTNYDGYPENFTVALTLVSPNPTPSGIPIPTYQVDVTWPHLGGSGQDDIKLFYQTNGQQ